MNGIRLHVPCALLLASATLALPGLAQAAAAACMSDPSGRCGDHFDGATILIVDTIVASGAGSLRQAILDANADPGPHIIGFNISGTCPQTLNIGSLTELPVITKSLSIRGYTQPGSSPNTRATGDDATICIELKVASGNSAVNGLRFAPTDVAETLDVSGLSIGGFERGIRIEGGNYTIGGNFLGLAADGSTQRSNAYDGIAVYASNSYFATTRRIGGVDSAERNVISENGTGVMLASGGGNVVRNNFIGTTRSGAAVAGNANGIYASSLSNDIRDNVISGNAGAAIRLEGINAAANSVAGNRIGLKSVAVCLPPPCTPDDALGNAGEGVRIAAGAAGNSIAGNAIAYNDGAGVSLPGAGPQNSIVGNSMHDNGGLGIDLAADGVTPNDNDATAPAGAPNRLLNFPALTSAGGNAGGGNAVGVLQSTNGTYVIDFYADTLLDPSLHGEGRNYLGSGEVSISNAPSGNNGSVSFTLPISSSSSLLGKHISATATDANGNTSEFSEGRTYALLDVIFVDGFD